MSSIDEVERATKRLRCKESPKIEAETSASGPEEGGELLRKFTESDLAMWRHEWLLSENAPFPHFRLEQMVADPVLLRSLADELLSESMTWYAKRNDLYEFRQSDDLKLSESPVVKRFRELIYSDVVVSLIEKITGITNLSRTTIDLFAAVYEQGNTLLPHDDRLEGRRVAYIFYLTPPDWQEEDGGHLDLFSEEPATDQREGGPYRVAKSLLPMWNSFAFFQVSTKSFHQVREVIADKTRLSIGGWFHGTSSTTTTTTLDPPSQASSSSSSSSAMDSEWIAPAKIPLEAIGSSEDDSQFDLEHWINPMYLRLGIIKQIREAYAEQGSLQLSDFFKPDRWGQLVEALGDAATRRESTAEPVLPGTLLCGPAHKQRYFRYVGDANALQQLRRFVTSDQFRSYIDAINSGALVEPSGERSGAELRAFTPGCYTLMHDHDDCLNTNSVDVILSLSGSEDWDDGNGGFVAYIKDHEELASISPQANSLSVVLRPTGAMRFVKFLTHRVEQNRIDVTISFEVSAESSE